MWSVDGALLFRTDALLARHTTILFTVPQNLYPRVTYSMALTAAGTSKREARAFLAYLRSGESKQALARFGFETR